MKLIHTDNAEDLRKTMKQRNLTLELKTVEYIRFDSSYEEYWSVRIDRQIVDHSTPLVRMEQ